MSDWLDARNILAVRMDNIGDVVMLGPALRSVKAAMPDSRITLLGSPAGVQAAPLLPWIDDVIEWRSVWQDVGGRMAFDPGREENLVALLRERQFDAALIFTSFSQTPHVPAYVCYLAGIPLRAGESKEFGGSVLSYELRGATDDLHQVDRNLRLVESLGFPVTDRSLEVAITEADRLAAADLFTMAGIALDQPIVLLHPGASAAARRYRTEGYTEAAKMFVESGWQVVVTGTDREAEIVSAVVRDVQGVIMVVGNTTLGQYAAMIEAASVVVCGNTLPLHLADAVNTPVVALYAGTDLESQWEPRYAACEILRRPTPCYPCYRFDCQIGHPCLDIAAEEIVVAASRLRLEPAVESAVRWEVASD